MMRVGQALARLALPFGAAALFAGLLQAERHFPGEFDYRYMTVSRLLSARDDPTGYAWAVAGIECGGLAIFLWTVLSTNASSSADTPADGVRALRWGSVGMMAVGVVPLRMALLPKLHEVLTIIAFFGLCLGVVRIVRTHTSEYVARCGLDTRRARLLGSLASGLLPAPIVLAGIAQAYVFYARPDLHWVGLSWRTRGVPAYLSFAFWEWMTCALLVLYLLACGAAAFAAGERARDSDD